MKSIFEGFVGKLNKAWSKDFYLDTHFINDQNLTTDNKIITFLYKEMLYENMNVIPVINVNQHTEDYIKILAEICKPINRICLRINADESLSMALNSEIDKLLKEYSVSPKDVDVILDYKYVLNNQEAIISSSIIQSFLNIPYLLEWNNVAIACTSFPMDMSIAERDSIKEVKRVELAIWKNLVNNGRLQRQPIFCDYGISNPDVTDFDPLKMQVSANIRYTSEDVWYLVKGRSTKVKSSAEQNVSLCQKIINQDFYCGEKYSWGDEYISKCARKEVTPGNPTTWRKVGTNHHLTLTTNQISSFV